MAYVGNTPSRGQWRKLTDISASFNGVTTTFTTSVPPGTSAYYVTAGTASQLIISLGGVIQEPDVDYTVSTNSITFTTAPAAGLSFFGVLCGDALNAGVPSDGSVSTSKLGTNLTVDLASGSAAAPSLTFDANTGVYSPGEDQVAISTNGTGRLSIDANGNVNIDSNTLYVDAVNNRVGIGTTSPIYTNHIKQNTTYGFGLESNTDDSRLLIGNVSSTWRVAATYGSTGSFQPITFFTSDLERVRLDTSGRLLVGTSSARTIVQNSGASKIQVEAVDGSAALQLITNLNSTAGPVLFLGKSRGASLGSNTVVQNGDTLGSIQFAGADGSDLDSGAAAIACEVDGTPGTNDMPGRLVFSTTADGASSPTERMRIRSDGIVDINTTDGGNPIVANKGFIRLYGAGSGDSSYFQSFQGVVAYMNRKGNDGELIQFRQDDAIEGSISVSGTTVSYNGAHLSRWSQLPSGAERTEILRGTVLSNIDEMCEWGEEDNEQLNRMKVSDVEGDKNVSGVFQAWDDDDDTYTNDFYCAMTGDFIIRIGAGVTVQRGDLLMSAGDGTAKPQGDGFVQDKTIAKVTSTNVSCTYDDGSYCVPCVLMAC